MNTTDEATARDAAHDILDQLLTSVTRDDVVKLLTGDDYDLDTATAKPIASRVVELIRTATVTLTDLTATERCGASTKTSQRGRVWCELGNDHTGQHRSLACEPWTA